MSKSVGLPESTETAVNSHPDDEGEVSPNSIVDSSGEEEEGVAVVDSDVSEGGEEEDDEQSDFNPPWEKKIVFDESVRSFVEYDESRQNGTSFEVLTAPLSPEIRKIVIPREWATFEIVRENPDRLPEEDELGGTLARTEEPSSEQRLLEGRQLHFRVEKVLDYRGGFQAVDFFKVRKTMGVAFCTTSDSDSQSDDDVLEIGTYGNWDAHKEASRFFQSDCSGGSHVRLHLRIPFDGIETVVRRSELSFARTDGPDCVPEGFIAYQLEGDPEFDQNRLADIPRKLKSWELEYIQIPFVQEDTIDGLFPEVWNSSSGGALGHLFSFLDVFEILTAILPVSKVFLRAGLLSLYSRQFSSLEYRSLFKWGSGKQKEGGICESLFHRIVQKNDHFDFDFRGTRLDSRYFGARPEEFDFLAYYFYRNWNDPDLLDLLLLKCDPSSLNSRFLSVFFRSGCCGTNKLDFGVAKKLMTHPNVDLLGLRQRETIKEYLENRNSFADDENEILIKLFLESKTVQESLSGYLLKSVYDALVRSDDLAGVKILIEVKNVEMNDLVGSRQFECACLSPEVVVFLVEDEDILLTPSHTFLIQVMKRVRSWEERIAEAKQVIRYLLDCTWDEGRGFVDPNECLIHVDEMSDDEVKGWFWDHPRVSKDGILICAAVSQDLEMLKKHLGYQVDKEFGVVSVAYEMIPKAADELMCRVAALGHTEVMKFLLEIPTFQPTQAVLAKAIDPPWEPSDFDRDRTDGVLNLFLDDERVQFGWAHISRLLENHNVRIVSKLLIRGMDSFSEDQVRHIYERLSIGFKEEALHVSLLTSISTYRMGALLAASDTWKNDVMTNLCEVGRIEVVKNLLEHPEFFVGVEINRHRLIDLIFKFSFELIRLFLTTTKLTAQQMMDSGVLKRLGRRLHDGTRLLEFLLEDPLFDPSAGRNTALHEAFERRNTGVISSLLKDPRVLANMNAARCFDVAIGVFRTDEFSLSFVHMLLEIEGFDPSRGSCRCLFKACEIESSEIFMVLFEDPRIKAALTEEILSKLVIDSLSPRRRSSDHPEFRVGLQELNDQASSRFNLDLIPQSRIEDIFKLLAEHGPVSDVRFILGLEKVMRVWKVPAEAIEIAVLKGSTEITSLLQAAAKRNG